MAKPILVGEAPGPNNGRDRPFEGPSGARLAWLIGEDWRQRVTAINLLDYWPGSAGPKGSLFDAQAAMGAANMLLRARRPTTLLLAGGRVARAFGIPTPATFFQHYALYRGRRWSHAFVVPHPSGISRWWNSEANRERAREWFRKEVP